MLTIQVKPWLLVTAGGLLISLMGATVWQAYARGSWQARAAALQAQVDSTNRLLKGYSADSARWAAVRADLQERATRLAQDSAKQAQQLADARRGRALADRALDSLRLAVSTDSLPPAAQGLVVGLEKALLATRGEATACSAALLTSQDQRSTCEVARDSLTSQIVSLEALKGRLTAERDTARSLLRPPSLFHVGLDLNAGFGCVAVPVTGEGPACGLAGQVTILRIRIPLLGGR